MKKVVKRKILHVGNILNNGYINCKYLRRRGIEADSLNVDYKHVQGQPEWEDVYIDEPVAEWNQDWSKVDLGGYKRPEWFYDVSLQELPDLALSLDKISGTASDGSSVHGCALPRTGREVRIAQTARRYTVEALRRVGLSRLIQVLKRQRSLGVAREVGLSAEDLNRMFTPLVREFMEKYPERQPSLSLNDIHDLLPRSLAHTAVFQRYHLVHAYSLDPIYFPLVNPSHLYVLSMFRRLYFLA